MTTLIQRMREELVRRHYAESTIRSYLHTIEDFRRYTHKRLDHLGPDDIRRYQVYLLEERQLNIGTASNYAAALRFFYVKTLKRPDLKEEMPYLLGVKQKRRLPVILSQVEVTRVIDSAKNLFHYTMLLTMYCRAASCGFGSSAFWPIAAVPLGSSWSGNSSRRAQTNRANLALRLLPILAPGVVPVVVGR